MSPEVQLVLAQAVLQLVTLMLVLANHLMARDARALPFAARDREQERDEDPA